MIDRSRVPALAELAETRHGVLSREDIAALGLSTAAMGRLVEAGILRRLHAGVYAFGHRALRPAGIRMAAVLAGGAGATLSHLSAAVEHLLMRGHAGRPHIIVPRDAAVRDRRIAAHRCRLPEEDVMVRAGMRVTRPMRTLVDCADIISESRLAELFDEAMLRGLYDHREMLRLVERARGRRGLKRLHRVLATIGDEPPGYRSRAERRAADVLRSADVPTPVVNAAIPLGDGRYREADLWWPDLRLDVEIDGPHHALPHRRRGDVVRDAELAAVGVSVLRFPEILPPDFVDRVREEIARTCVEICSHG